MKGDQLLKQWKQAKETCQKIIQISIASNLHNTVLGKQSNQQFMRVYDVVYRLCSNRETEETRVVMVYKDYKQMLKNALLKLSKQLQKERQICKLKVLKKIWDAYEDIMKRLKHMFAYLNRPFHLKEGKLQDLDRTAMVLIVYTFFNEDSLLQFDTIYFKNLSKMRDTSDYTDCQVLKDYVDILYRIHLRLLKKENKKARTLYTDFQQKYLSDARDFYKINYITLKEFSPSEYFIQINELFQRQRKLTNECFGINCETLINKAYSDQFLEEYREKLIKSPRGLKSILQNRESKTIKVITQLYKQLTNSIDGFKEPFQSFIFQQFSALLQQFRSQMALISSKINKTHHHVSLIKSLITRYSELVQILRTSFMKYGEFISYFKNGIERAFSRTVLSPQIQQLLAFYLQLQMKTSYQSQDQLLEAIRSILLIFQCVQNKDLFLIKYLQKLCRNIIAMSLEALNNHQAFIYQLKMHSGIRVAERLETIIDEYKLSIEQQRLSNDDMMEQNYGEKQLTFKLITKQQKLNYQMNIRVFSEGVWPFQDIITFEIDKLPSALFKGAQCVKLYQDNAVKKKVVKLSYIDSKIRWVYHFEKKEEQTMEKQDKIIRTGNPDMCYFDTNAVQAVLLMYIYERRPNRVSISLLQQIFKKQIKPQFLFFSLKKMSQTSEYQILIKQVQEEQIFFRFNKNMHTKKRLINYDTSNIEEVQEQKLFQKVQLGRDRQFTIDANIAKLMKAKKVLSYDRIGQQVIKMIKIFSPSFKDIKSSIQRLIQKEILARDEKDKSVLRYKD